MPRSISNTAQTERMSLRGTGHVSSQICRMASLLSAPSPRSIAYNAGDFAPSTSCNSPYSASTTNRQSQRSSFRRNSGNVGRISGSSCTDRSHRQRRSFICNGPDCVGVWNAQRLRLFLCDLLPRIPKRLRGARNGRQGRAVANSIKFQVPIDDTLECGLSRFDGGSVSRNIVLKGLSNPHSGRAVDEQQNAQVDVVVARCAHVLVID